MAPRPDGAQELPRVCYVGSLSVENTSAGSLQLFRLLQICSPERVHVVELECPSARERRIPKVAYSYVPARLPPGWGFARRHCGFLFLLLLRVRSWLVARYLARMLRPFAPEAIVTLHEKFGWLTAAALSRRLKVPLHFVLHDDWFRNWARDRTGLKVERLFGITYRAAKSRLCISPNMVEEYRKRFGALGSVLYPMQDDVTVPETGCRAATSESSGLVVAYAGNVFTAGYWETLGELATALDGIGGRLLLFGPITSGDLDRAGLVRQNVELFGFADHLISTLRRQADVAFVPMTFEAEMAANMRVSFPSKIADYTKAGLPLLVYGPDYSSAVRWGRRYGTAEVVSEKGSEFLRDALIRLLDPDHRETFAKRSREAGVEFFSKDVVGETFQMALLGGTLNGSDRDVASLGSSFCAHENDSDPRTDG